MPEENVCDLFKKAVKDVQKISENLDAKFSEWKERGESVVDFKGKNYDKYIRRKGCSVQSVGSLHCERDKQVISGEILVPHCCETAPSHAPMFLVTPHVDLCTPGCEIEQVHVHDGPCPGTHIHIRCDLKKQTAKRHCVGKIADVLGKLSEFTLDTCG